MQYQQEIENGSQPSINLSLLNDRQNVYLSMIAYADINEEGRRKLLSGESMKISELANYLENPDAPYFGSLGTSENGLKSLGIAPFAITESEFVNLIVDSGLGDIEILALQDNSGAFANGFQAMAFEDSFGNHGISYRGSDFDLTKGAFRDWAEANFMEYFIGDSSQVKSANAFFDKYKNQDGSNYIYGGSLGGNLSQHVYADHYNEIAQIFTFNANPINQNHLDTPEKIAAFNDSTKAHFNIVCGDAISFLKKYDLYQDNVTYVKNNGTLPGIINHLAEAIQYDASGNFSTTDREEAIEALVPAASTITDFSSWLREKLNATDKSIDEIANNFTNAFTSAAKQVLDNASNLISDINSYTQAIDLNILCPVEIKTLNNEININEICHTYMGAQSGQVFTLGIDDRNEEDPNLDYERK